jgi:hypothetical protein
VGTGVDEVSGSGYLMTTTSASAFSSSTSPLLVRRKDSVILGLPARAHSQHVRESETALQELVREHRRARAVWAYRCSCTS